jgi:hypothetical protein
MSFDSLIPRVALSGGLGTYRFLQAEEEIKRKDLKVEALDLRSILSYLMARTDRIALRAGATHLRVDEETAQVSLHVEEFKGERRSGKRYRPSTELHASARPTKLYEEVKRLVAASYSPAELAEAIYNVPYLFDDESHYVATVNTLRSVVATVTSVQQDTTNESGTDREKKLRQSIDGVPDIEIKLSFPFYVGEASKKVAFKLFYGTQGMAVTVRMRNPRLPGLEAEARKEMLDKFVADVHVIGAAHASNWRLPILYGAAQQ